MTFQCYANKYGYTEKDLAAVAVQTRKHAMLNENAVMRTPLTVEDYLASRYIVRPLHIFDLCLVNDGGVCLILRKTEQAKDMPRAPVKIAGWGATKGTKTSGRIWWSSPSSPISRYPAARPSAWLR